MSALRLIRSENTILNFLISNQKFYKTPFYYASFFMWSKMLKHYRHPFADRKSPDQCLAFIKIEIKHQAERETFLH